MGNHGDGKHLASNLHDVTTRITDTWCGSFEGGATESVDRATCLDCLSAAAEYGKAAAKRYLDIVTKA